MVWIIVLSVLLLITFWVLWTPIRITLNTKNNTYRLSWGVLIAGQIVGAYRDLILVLEIAGRRISWSAIELLAKTLSQRDSVNNPEEDKAARRQKSRRVSFDLAKTRRVFQSFKVKDFHLELDTGDYPLNAMLFPLATRFRKHLDINFQDRNSLKCTLENRPISIIKAVLM